MRELGSFTGFFGPVCAGIDPLSHGFCAAPVDIRPSNAGVRAFGFPVCLFVSTGILPFNQGLFDAPVDIHSFACGVSEFGLLTELESGGI